MTNSDHTQTFEVTTKQIVSKKLGGLPIVAWCLIAIFFVKTIVLGFWIVPLWDIPDEIGHFAYARDIASGNGILPLRKAKIGEDILTHIHQRPTAEQNNWIVQHPPLYHIIAGVAWKGATHLTDDPEWLFRAPRIISALFGALTLLFIFKIAEIFCLSENTSLAVMAGFSAIPMFTWLSAGTNHDTLVALLGSASTYYFVQFFQNQKMCSAYISVFLMSLAAATKMTALVALAPLTGLLLLEITGGVKQWLQRATLLVTMALAIPGLWLVRNILEYGTPFATSLSIMGGFRMQDNPLDTPFFSFLQIQPAIEHFFVNFFGLIGWIGKGAGKLSWFQIQHPFLTPYEIVVLFVCIFAVIWFSKTITHYFYQENSEIGDHSIIVNSYQQIGLLLRYGFVALLVIVTGCTLIISHHIVSTTVASWLIVPTFSLIFALFVLPATVFVVPICKAQRSIFHAVLIVAFFSAVLLWKIYGIYLLDGRLRATHGRYFYPLLGMLVVGFVVPALLILGKFAERIALPSAIIICFTEAAFYFIKVLPYVTSSGCS